MLSLQMLQFYSVYPELNLNSSILKTNRTDFYYNLLKESSLTSQEANDFVYKMLDQNNDYT